MKRFTRKFITMAAALLLTIWGFGQTKVSTATGNWSDPTKWNPAGVPAATDNVFIDPGHTITVDGPFACADLNISTTGIIAAGTNTLTVNGKLRAYTGAAPGTSSNAPGAACITTTTGKLVLTFADSIAKVGEWGGNPHSWRAEFAIAGGGTASLGTNFKAGDIIVSSGTISTASDIRADFNTANTGTLTINAGTRLRFTAGGNIRRTGTAGSTCNTVTINGTLEYAATTVGAVNTVTYNTTGATIVYSNNGAQTLNTQITTCANLVLSGSGIKTTNTALSVQPNGTVTVNGTQTCILRNGTGSLSYGANGTLIISSTSGFYNLNGYADFPHIWPATNGPANVTVTANTFRVHSPSFDRTITGALTLNGGTLVVRDTATLRFANNASIVRTNGQLRTATSTTPGLPGTILHGLVAGDKVNLVMGYSDTTRAEFPSAATITPGSIGTLTINNGAEYILAAGPHTITDLVFSSGKINLVDDTLSVSGNITGASSSNYVITDAAGDKLQRPVGATNVLFPVGPSGTLYHPVTMNNTGTADNFYVNVASAVPTCVSAPGSVNATWDIGEAVAGGSSVGLILDFTGASTGGSYNSATAVIAHCNGATADNSSGSVSGTIATGGPFTTFSPYGVTSDLLIVPVKLISFSGTHSNGENRITWLTAQEVNLKGFELQRSADGLQFSGMGFIDAGRSSYTFNDILPLAGRNYYRLKMTDKNGTVNYSSVISVLADAKAPGIKVYPTITTGNIYIVSSSSQQKQYRLMGANGNLVASGKLAANGVLDISAQPAGMYYLTVDSSSFTIIKK